MNVRASLIAFLLASSSGASSGGIVEDWNAALIRSVQAETTPPCLVARNLAILHAAMHDAINTTAPKYALWLPANEALAGAAYASPEIAAMRAAHTIALTLCPARQAEFDTLLSEQHRSVDVESDAAARAGEIGVAVARRILSEREADGTSTTSHYVPIDRPGQWRRPSSNRPPELPAWRHVKPFCLKSAGQFRPAGPPGLDSPQWRADLEAVRNLGSSNSTCRTVEQTMLARFWADFSYSSTPPGRWNDIARAVSSDRGLGLHESARLFAWLNLALADAGIAAWDCKYHYNAWRPDTAIATATPGAQWTSLLPMPPHPEYVSGHSTFSGTAAAVLKHAFGNSAVTIRSTSLDVPGVTRTWDSFDACRDEIGMSRVWGGIHFPHSNKDGVQLGTRVAGVVLMRLK